MVVVNKTTFTSEEAYSYIYKSVSKEYKKTLVLPVIISILSIPILIVGLGYKQMTSAVLGLIFMGAALTYLIYSLVKFYKLPKVIKRNNEDICKYGVKYEYKFRERSVDCLVDIIGKTKTINLKYTELKRTIEYEDYYELVFGDNDSLFVLKKGFENEKMEEFFRHNITLDKRKIISRIKK